MGLFGKKKESSPSGFLGWLNDADAAYSRSLQTKDISLLEPYVDQACARKILSMMRANEKAYAGLDRYKHVSWSKSSSAGDCSVYKKTVKYDHVKLSQGVIAPVGQDYTEEWTITMGDKPKVTEIRRLSA